MVTTQHISKSKFTNQVNHAVTKRHELDYETLSFVHVVETSFNLKPILGDHIIWVLKRLKSDYHSLCNGITYENMVIACALYSMKVSGLPVYESQSVDSFIEELYKPENQIPHESDGELHDLEVSSDDILEEDSAIVKRMLKPDVKNERQ
jgi:hypothetical protein